MFLNSSYETTYNIQFLFRSDRPFFFAGGWVETYLKPFIGDGMAR